MSNYYKIGYITPSMCPSKNMYNKLPKPLCYENLSCATKNFSMCRFPNTHWQARVFYPRYQPSCGCDKYLYKV